MLPVVAEAGQYDPSGHIVADAAGVALLVEAAQQYPAGQTFKIIEAYES